LPTIDRVAMFAVCGAVLFTSIDVDSVGIGTRTGCCRGSLIMRHVPSPEAARIGQAGCCVLYYTSGCCRLSVHLPQMSWDGHLSRPARLVSMVHTPVPLMPSHVPPLVTGNWNWRPRLQSSLTIGPPFVSPTAPLSPVLNPGCTGPATLLSSFFHRPTVLPMKCVPHAAATTTTMMKMTMTVAHRCPMMLRTTPASCDPTTTTMTKMTMTPVHRCPMRMRTTPGFLRSDDGEGVRRRRLRTVVRWLDDDDDGSSSPP
jgi:hypothetical protein